MYLIAITGGPCGGKSQSMDKLVEELSAHGYKVLTVPEAATKLINSGIIPGQTVDIETFQRFVLREQLHNEDLMIEAAKLYQKNYKDVIILCDRGLPDQMAYISKPKFRELLKQETASRDVIINMAECYGRYDCAIHMLTAADGAIEHYKWAGSENKVGVNIARSESPQEAIQKDILTQNAWMGCDHYRIIDNSTDFPKKIYRALNAVFSTIGEPVPLEIERKFVLAVPLEEDLKKLNCTSSSEIIQTYLKSDNPFIERRVRQRGSVKDGFRFYYTEKTKVAYATWEESEKRIDMQTYIELLSEADPEKHQIKKTRHCFLYRGHYFELDIYPFDNYVAILEVEVDDIDEHVSLPFLSIQKEVTGDERYKNSSIAKTMTIPHEF